jgi:hypothetical protein
MLVGSHWISVSTGWGIVSVDYTRVERLMVKRGMAQSGNTRKYKQAMMGAVLEKKHEWQQL